MWSSLIINPTATLVKACIRETLLKLLDFADDEVREEVKTKLSANEETFKVKAIK